MNKQIFLNLWKFFFVFVFFCTSSITARASEEFSELRVFKRKTSTLAHYIAFSRKDAKIFVSECELNYEKLMTYVQKFEPTENFQKYEADLVRCVPLGPEIIEERFKNDVTTLMNQREENASDRRWNIAFAGINIFVNFASAFIFSAAAYEQWGKIMKGKVGPVGGPLLLVAQVVFVTGALISVGFRSKQTGSEYSAFQNELENAKTSPLDYKDIFERGKTFNSQTGASAIFLDIKDYDTLKSTWETSLNQGGVFSGAKANNLN